MIRLFLLFFVFSVEAVAEENVKTIGQGAAPVSSIGVLQWILSCVLVIGVMFACLWLLKKTKLVPGGKNSLLKVIACIPLNRSERLLIVKVGSRYLLLGSTYNAINNLAELSKDEVESYLEQNSSSGSFSEKFQAALMGKFLKNKHNENKDEQEQKESNDEKI